LGQRIEATLAPEAVLPIAAETVAQALQSPYVAILMDRDEAPQVAAQYGAVSSHYVRLPLVYQAEPVGELRVALHANRLEFSLADRRLLEDLARQIGLAVHAARLTADLRHSRERLITLREEERRRLRRDLHDGLGPRIAAQTLKLGSARALLTRDSALADTLLGELEGDIAAALASIRRLVYNLRPPLLDQLGLVGAVQATVTEFQLSADAAAESLAAAERATRSVPVVTLEVIDDLPPLPAAVEVAAYHIIQEALTNSVRHANAHTCHVQVAMATLQGRPALDISVRDDGGGLPATLRQGGVGLTSMRERAEELGGVFRIARFSDRGGTVIQAVLPVSLAPEGEEPAQAPVASLSQPSSKE
jgi:signal transduction histidine kinase